MKKSSTVYLGMDAHKASIEISLAKAGAIGEEHQ